MLYDKSYSLTSPKGTQLTYMMPVVKTDVCLYSATYNQFQGLHFNLNNHLYTTSRTESWNSNPWSSTWFHMHHSSPSRLTSGEVMSHNPTSVHKRNVNFMNPHCGSNWLRVPLQNLLIAEDLTYWWSLQFRNSRRHSVANVFTRIWKSRVRIEPSSNFEY